MIDYDKIDCLMRTSIRILNEKGYPTMFCCQGHEDFESFYLYILFDKRCNLLTTPEGFQIRKYSNGTAMYYQEKVFRQAVQTRQIDRLNEWALSLHAVADSNQE